MDRTRDIQRLRNLNVAVGTRLQLEISVRIAFQHAASPSGPVAAGETLVAADISLLAEELCPEIRWALSQQTRPTRLCERARAARGATSVTSDSPTCVGRDQRLTARPKRNLPRPARCAFGSPPGPCVPRSTYQGQSGAVCFASSASGVSASMSV